MQVTSEDVRKHDRFNIVALSAIVVADIIYLCVATDFSKLGTNELGKEHSTFGVLLNLAFALYLFVDLVWVAFNPKCVASAPIGIIIHHILCLVLIMVPLFYTQFLWHSAINMSIETNTLFLTLRRNTPMGTAKYHVYNFLFYLCWISMRLLLYPMLVVFFYMEYRRYSAEVGSPYNFVILSFLLEFLITAMGFKWTFDMVRKNWFKKGSPPDSSSQGKVGKD